MFISLLYKLTLHALHGQVDSQLLNKCQCLANLIGLTKFRSTESGLNHPDLRGYVSIRIDD